MKTKAFIFLGVLFAVLLISAVAIDDDKQVNVAEEANQVNDEKYSGGGYGWGGPGGGGGGWGGPGGGGGGWGGPGGGGGGWGGWGGGGGWSGGGGGRGWGGGGGGKGWGRGGGGGGWGGNCRWGTCCSGRGGHGGGCRCCYSAHEAIAYMQNEP